MRHVIFILFLFLYISCNHTRNAIVQNDILKTAELYTITKIKNEKSFYIVYAQRNDSTFKIVSTKKNVDDSNCRKIKIKNGYNLELRKIFPLDSIMGYAIAPNLGIVFTYGEENKIVPIEEKSHFSIYHVTNLQGLCIIE